MLSALVSIFEVCSKEGGDSRSYISTTRWGIYWQLQLVIKRLATMCIASLRGAYVRTRKWGEAIWRRSSRQGEGSSRVDMHAWLAADQRLDDDVVMGSGSAALGWSHW